MAYSKPELDKIETKVQWLFIHFRGQLSKMLYDTTGSEKFNIVLFKPEVPISKLVEKIGTTVQRLYIHKYMFTRSSYPMGLTGVYCDLIPENLI